MHATAVLGHELRTYRRGLLYWSLGIAALTLLVTNSYEMARNMPDIDNMLRNAPPALRALRGQFTSLRTSEGFLNSQLFFMMAPLLLILYAVGAGARGIAGEEEGGSLSLLLSQPVTRRQVLLQKALSLTVRVSVLGAVLFVSLVLGAARAHMPLPTLRLLGAIVSLVLLALVFGMTALCVGAATGRRGVAVAAGALFAVASYLLQAFAPMSSALRSVRSVSPYYHYIGYDPLLNGLQVAHVGVLAAVIVGALVSASVVFTRRDLRG